ncbi:hypothetical protein BDV06DRAFT_222341 [Aspergillus oleicola]
MSFDTYSICDSVPGALPQTHPTIVATITASGNPTTTRPTTITTTRTTSTDTGTTTDPTTTKTDHTPTTTDFESPTSNTESTSTDNDEPTSTTTNATPEPTSSGPSDTSSKGSALNSGAVIGVSVASGIAGFFIIGVIIFFCCRKIRRKAQDREFFEIGGHMSEPPDFNFPPRRPPMGPRPSPGSHPTDSESARLVTPADTVYHDPGYNAAHFPAVIVTEPEEDRDQGGHMSATNADRAGHQSSSWDYETASIASSRTVSDLLPDKPTYELYPRPLRWSLHKKSRPASGATFIEDKTGSKPLPSPTLPQFTFTPTSERGQGRLPMTGLPANPRAMKYGFAGPGQTQAMKASARGKRPVYSNEEAQSSRQAASREISRYTSSQIDYDDDLDNYWKKNPDAGFVGAKVIQPQRVAHSPMRGAGAYKYENSPKYAGYDFEFGFGDNPSSAQPSRHSGGFRPLSPVKEIRTPMGEVQNPMGDSSSSSNVSTPTPAPRYPPRQALGPGPPTQSQEVVSRPRIFRQDDIKRVQIRRPNTSKPLPSPKEVTVPYCPDDYWIEQSNEASNAGYNVPTATPPRTPGGHNYGPKGPLGMPKKKPAPTERNLTPSRRGADLILQVE